MPGSAPARACKHPSVVAAQRRSEPSSERAPQRYEFLGARADLDEAIDLGSESVRHGADRPARQSARFINLALSLFERARLTASLDELDDAIRWARAAAESAVEYRDAALCLSNIAAMLEARSHLSDTPERDLEESVQAARESVRALPDDHSERVLNVRNLGALLYRMFSRLGTADLLREAISLTREAIASTAHPAEQCPGQFNLGVMLMANFHLTQDATCFTEAMEAWATAASTTAGDPRSRLDAAPSRGPGSVTASTAPVAMAVWHGLTADDRRLRLVAYSGLARGCGSGMAERRRKRAQGRRAPRSRPQCRMGADFGSATRPGTACQCPTRPRCLTRCGTPGTRPAWCRPFFCRDWRGMTAGHLADSVAP